MSRRVILPGADELLRATGRPALTDADDPGRERLRAVPDVSEEAPAESGEVTRAVHRTGPRRPSGRERHDEKITVYVTAAELLDLEHARLKLRGEHGVAIDRGRLVREALALVIAELERAGEDSALVRRLRET